MDAPHIAEPGTQTGATGATGLDTETPRERSPRFRKLEGRLSTMYAQPLRVLIPMAESKPPEFQTAVLNYSMLSPAAAAAWVDVAEQDPSVAQSLEKMVEGGAWGSLVLIHIALLVPFLPPHILERLPFMGGNSNGHAPDAPSL